MLLYNLRLAWLSLRRNPVLALLAIGAIALGISVANTAVTCHVLLSGDPIPTKSDRLFNVRLDSWSAESPFDSDLPDLPPTQLTYQDAVALMESDIPTHHSAMYKAILFVHPDRPEELPFTTQIRLTFRDFFSLFARDFAYGGAWDEQADEGPEAVAVISSTINERLFGGGDSVGKSLRVGTQTFRISGVLEPWQPKIKFYDIHNGSQDLPEEIYIPFHWSRALEIETAGNTNGWAGRDPGYEGLLRSESVWVQFWAELEDENARQAYQSFLDAYTNEQRTLGRFARPQNNLVQPLLEWLEEGASVPPESRAMMVVALLFLVVCAINLIGLLLGKFLARAPEVGVRRALGASRRAVFTQHIVECQLVAVIGGAIGVLLSLGAIKLLNRTLEGQTQFQISPLMLSIGLALALGAGLLAGIYPAWRICIIPPASHLKAQ